MYRCIKQTNAYAFSIFEYFSQACLAKTPFSYPWRKTSLHKKMKLSIKDFFSKCDQIRRILTCTS